VIIANNKNNLQDAIYGLSIIALNDYNMRISIDNTNFSTKRETPTRIKIVVDEKNS
jgi:hypothetical protein